MMTKTLHSEEETLLFGELIAKGLKAGTFCALEGPLGAGKTCISRGILRGMGHAGHVKSPTYPLVEIYNLKTLTVYHFDFYRIIDPIEILEAGFRDMFGGENICLVEWADKGKGSIPIPDITISLTFNRDSRNISINAISQLGQQCLEEIL
ncbi:tRNA (adenosine(37)-N6)-threonylcarbamoyltransferase complex ATPase subunit type 1 TsaE [Burkholderiales bacterium]|nr:tRNA (adenosine(37)-N6)-threonylcarbamoyltransferase complex ATPase subunit type 1 TsaE [Burkholderiales bacterium]